MTNPGELGGLGASPPEGPVTITVCPDSFGTVTVDCPVCRTRTAIVVGASRGGSSGEPQ